MYVNWPALVEEPKAGNFHPINIALVGRSMEASGIALDLMLALRQAGVLGRYIDLSAIRMTCAVACTLRYITRGVTRNVRATSGPWGFRHLARSAPRGSEALRELRDPVCGHRPFAWRTRIMDDSSCRAKSDPIYRPINKGETGNDPLKTTPLTDVPSIVHHALPR